MFGGGIMRGDPKKGVKLDELGLRGLLLGWGAMLKLELVVVSGLTSADVLVFGVISSEVLGA